MEKFEVNERELILNILLEVSKGEYLNLLLKQVLDKYAYLSIQSRSFIKTVTEGSVERRLTLDFIIEQFSSVKVKKMKPVIREILRMSVYQLKFMEKVPSSAVINEAVKLAKRHKFNGLSGFVNGVLRNIDRHEGSFDYPDLEKQYSCPMWICSLLEKEFGRDNAVLALEASLKPSPVCIRLTSRFPVGETVSEIEKEGAKLTPHPIFDGAYYISDFGKLSDLKSFNDGRFAVMDASSQLAVRISGIKPGDKVVDLCSAPGGKACFAAEMATPSGSITALDISEDKIPLIEENAKRLKVELHAESMDATIFNPEFEKAFDVVLADVPCSGLGVFGRKSDLKYRVTMEDVHSLKTLSRKIIDNAVKYVRPGGTLIFSTCTVTEEENTAQVKYILDNYDFETVDISRLIPEKLKDQEAAKGYVRLLQGRDECDGFFACRLKCK